MTQRPPHPHKAEWRATSTPWWSRTNALARLVADLVAAEWRTLRPGAEAPPREAWTCDLSITASDEAPTSLQADSLELVHLATAWSELLQIRETGIDDYLLARRTLGGWVEVARESLQRFDARLVFRTSGSTGAPKPCGHARADLEREARHFAERMRAAVGISAFRIVQTVPSHHIYGFLFTQLLPAALDADVEDARGRLPGRILDDAKPGDVIVATPEFWRMTAMTGGRLDVGVIGVNAAGPLDGACGDLVAAADGRFFDIYGSSETAGVGFRTRLDAPYRLLPWWRLDEDAAALLHEDGRPETAPPDKLEPVDEGFRLMGRRDGVVQIGGVNVDPAHVARVLNEHENVAEAYVRTMATPQGLRLKAFVVPAEGVHAADLSPMLEVWAKTRLAPQALPRHVRFGAAPARNAMGKLCDWPIDD